MMTTISNALGHSPLMTQQGVGATPGYDAIDARRFWSVGIQEGVISAGSYMVTQRGAGANLSVDIAASTGDGAVVQGDAVTAQGLYYIAPHSAVINETITTAHATLPRIDQVVLEIKDTQHDASGSNLAQTRVVAGTATGGATLDNRTGAAALPSSAILLADVLVAATDTAISNSEIRDRRPWVRGAFKRITDTSGNKTTSSSTLALMDSTNLNPRVECSGVPLRVTVDCDWLSNTANAETMRLDLFVDGVAQALRRDAVDNEHTGLQHFSAVWVLTPTAGSHKIGLAWSNAGNVNQIRADADATNPLIYVIEELIVQDTANNTTTTG
jgi:hypothetical protein